MRSTEILNRLHQTLVDAEEAIAEEMETKLVYEPTNQDRLEYLVSVLHRNKSQLPGGPLDVVNIEEMLRRKVAIELLARMAFH